MRIFIGFAEWILPFNSSVVARRAAPMDLYTRSLRGVVRSDSLVFSDWSLAVATYQHHVIDIVGGFVGRVLLLPISRAFPCVAGCRESPHRLTIQRQRWSHCS